MSGRRPLLLVRLALRNARRNVSRTALTAATVVVGTALLTAALAWLYGVFGTLTSASAAFGGEVRVVQPDYAEREELMPLYEHLPDAEALVDTVSEVPGVRAAYPRILTPVTLTVGEELGDTFGLAMGAPVAWYRDELGLQDDLVEGPGFAATAEQAAEQVVLGRQLAEQLDAEVGDTVLLVGQTQDGAISPVEATLAGIVSAGSGRIDQAAFLPLGPLQWMADVGPGATELLVYGAHRDDAASLAARLAELPATTGLSVVPWHERPLIKGFIAVAQAVQAIIAVVIVFITALGVWNTMMMSVLERTAEIGVLRAMGLGRGGAITLFVLEGLVIATLGGALGVGLGSAVGLYLETTGVHFGDTLAQNTRLPVQTTMYADMGVEVAAFAFAMGLATALVGTAVPAWHAARITPVDAMRGRR